MGVKLLLLAMAAWREHGPPCRSRNFISNAAPLGVQAEPASCLVAPTLRRAPHLVECYDIATFKFFIAFGQNVPFRNEPWRLGSVS